MFAFPSMFVGPAEAAGMNVPSDPDNFNRGVFPHFSVFLNVCLGIGMPYPSCHWDNAKVIAELSDEEILSVTFEDLVRKGLSICT